MPRLLTPIVTVHHGPGAGKYYWDPTGEVQEANVLTFRPKGKHGDIGVTKLMRNPDWREVDVKLAIADDMRKRAYQE